MMNLMDITTKEREGMKGLDRLVRAVDKAYHHPGPLIWRGFLIGLASGLGATIGVAIVLGVLGFILRELGGIPFIGDWLQGVNSVIEGY